MECKVAAPAPRAPTFGGAGKRRVLVVDDEPCVLSSIERVLRREFEVCVATSGPEALQMLAEREIPILVTDQRMPGMTGVELLAETHRCAPLTIGILLTGYSDLPAVIEAINIGQVFRYREKPWDVDVLRGDLEAAGQLYDAQVRQSEQLQRLNTHLEEEVRARTDEIRIQNIRLMELERLKGRFLANISHQLRTPLSLIKTSLQLLEVAPPAKHAAYLANALQAEQELEDMILAALDFSGIDLGADSLAREPVEIHTLVSRVVTPRLAMAEEKGISFLCTPGAEEAWCDGDERLLGKALDGIVLNALTYTQSGGAVRVTVGSEGRALPAGKASTVAIAVCDTGPGISAEDQRGLFQAFFRGGQGEVGRHGGLGLGLAVAAAIARWHGGQIRVKSAPGKGSTFTLILPIGSAGRQARC